MLKKISLLISYVFVCLSCDAQLIRIQESTNNRPLVWEDYTGKPDKSSSFDAFTSWKVGFRANGVTFKSDTAYIKDLSFDLEFDQKRSWIKKGKETDELLKHEQGHFNIGLLFQAELIERSKKMYFLRSGFQQKLQGFYDGLYKKYTAMQDTYDEETDHSKNKAGQEKWDQFFKSALTIKK